MFGLKTIKARDYAALRDKAEALENEIKGYYENTDARNQYFRGIATLLKGMDIPDLFASIKRGDLRNVYESCGPAYGIINRIAKAVYAQLGLISFLTAGEDEVKAWTIRKGLPAKKAAGKIHSDIERGFIRAETVAFDDLKSCGSMAAARDKGCFRLEGKEYIVADGDVINFRFNV